jgi:ATP-binding cassette subfamily F protein 3
VSRKDERASRRRRGRRRPTRGSPSRSASRRSSARWSRSRARPPRPRAWLSGAEAYEDGNRERLQEILKRRAEVAARIATLEDDWLWAQAEMEKAFRLMSPEKD